MNNYVLPEESMHIGNWRNLCSDETAAIFWEIVDKALYKAGKNAGHKLRQKCEFYTNFQKCLEEKDQNIYLDGKFHFKFFSMHGAIEGDS